MGGFFDIMDQEMADSLGVSVSTYINVIEKIPYDEAQFIIHGIWSEEDLKISKAKIKFNSYL